VCDEKQGACVSKDGIVSGDFMSVSACSCYYVRVGVCVSIVTVC
jgi:hypothetical protein